MSFDIFLYKQNNKQNFISSASVYHNTTYNRHEHRGGQSSDIISLSYVQEIVDRVFGLYTEQNTVKYLFNIISLIIIMDSNDIKIKGDNETLSLTCQNLGGTMILTKLNGEISWSHKDDRDECGDINIATITKNLVNAIVKRNMDENICSFGITGITTDQYKLLADAIISPYTGNRSTNSSVIPYTELTENILPRYDIENIPINRLVFSVLNGIKYIPFNGHRLHNLLGYNNYYTQNNTLIPIKKKFPLVILRNYQINDITKLTDDSRIPISDWVSILLSTRYHNYDLIQLFLPYSKNEISDYRQIADIITNRVNDIVGSNTYIYRDIQNIFSIIRDTLNNIQLVSEKYRALRDIYAG